MNIENIVVYSIYTPKCKVEGKVHHGTVHEGPERE
jgi:hypothetical protein